jgi:putative protease
VRYVEAADGSTTAKLGDFGIDCYAPDEKTGYPTICKGRYLRPGVEDPYYAFEEPLSLNLSALLPDLVRAGVSALKIEGRQRSRSYVQAVVSAYRQAIDDAASGRRPDLSGLAMLTEGGRQTEGAYATKKWR